MPKFLKAGATKLFAYEFNGEYLLTQKSMPPLDGTNYTEDDVISALVENGNFLDVDIWGVFDSMSFPGKSASDGTYIVDNDSFESICIKRNGLVYLYVFDDLIEPTVYTVEYEQIKF